VFFGDYNNVTAHDNVIRPIWTRLHNGQISVWTAIINLFETDIEEYDKPAIPFALDQNYPNPFKETTHFSFKVKSASTITLKIIDMYGRTVATMIDRETMSPGAYFEHFNASTYNLPSGVYYFALTGDNQNQVRKMIIEE
jgi:hypothetical protein